MADFVSLSNLVASFSTSKLSLNLAFSTSYAQLFPNCIQFLSQAYVDNSKSLHLRYYKGYHTFYQACQDGSYPQFYSSISREVHNVIFFQAVGDNSIENITIYCSKPPFFVIIGKLILKNMQQCSQSQTSSYVMFAKSVHIGSANHISDRLSIIVKGHCMSCAVFY